MAAPNQTIRDTFTGSNGPLSANWTSGLYSTSVAAEIVGNAFGGPSGAGFFDAYWDAATFGTVNAEVYATVSTKSATGELMYLVLRAQSPGTSGYDAYMLTLAPSAGTDTIGVVRTINEVDTTLDTRSQEVAAGDALALVALGAGATITIQVWYRASGGSWTQLGADISDTDANRITAAGYIGAGVEGITGRWDDFGGGDHVLGTVEQEGYRWRNDDGSESAATWLASQDTPLTLDVGTSARLRVLLNGTLDPAAAAGMQVSGDAGRLEQLLSNLLENSLRYTDAPGRVDIGITRTGPTLTLQVQDSAPGVAASHLPHLFEPLYRVDAARSRRNGGSGLGLAICDAIVRAHGGQMQASPSALGGLCIRVSLPLLPDSASAPPPPHD